VKDVRAYRRPQCGMDHYMLKKKNSSIQMRNKKYKNELDTDIKIEVHKYKLQLFHDESIKQLYKIRVF
jgi:hypothetical protein